MEKLKTLFLDKGQLVVIGEFGARNKNNLSDRVRYANYYVKKARKLKIPCIWLDNGRLYGEGELFGLMNRKKICWEFPEIVKALTYQVELSNLSTSKETKKL